MANLKKSITIDELKFLSITDKIEFIDKNRCLLIFLTALIRFEHPECLCAQIGRALPLYISSLPTLNGKYSHNWHTFCAVHLMVLATKHFSTHSICSVQ